MRIYFYQLADGTEVEIIDLADNRIDGYGNPAPNFIAQHPGEQWEWGKRGPGANGKFRDAHNAVVETFGPIAGPSHDLGPSGQCKRCGETDVEYGCVVTQ